MSAPVAVPSVVRPHVVIRPERGWASLELRELWRFRDLLGTLAARDVKVRYKQTALGAAWVVLQPLVAAGIFAFVFGRVARLPAPDGVPYFVFAFTGLLAWNAFAAAFTRSGNSIVGNAQLVSKVYFPRLLLPLASAAAAVVDFAVMGVLLLVLLAVWWELPGLSLLLLPACLALLLMLALGLGFIASALAVPYRDVPIVIPVAVQLLLYASPVAYAVAAVPADYRWLYRLNPLAALLEAFRWSVLGVGSVRWDWFAYAAAVSVAAFVGGAFAFRRMEREFADVV